MRYEIGVMSAVFSDVPLDEGVRKIAGHGFKIIELSGEQFEDYVRLDKNGVEKLNDARKEYDLTYTVHGPLTGLNLDSIESHIRKKAVKRLKWYLEAARDVESGILVLHPVPLTPVKIPFYEMKNRKLASIIGRFVPKIENAVRERMLMKYEVREFNKSVIEAYEVAESKSVSISCENLHIGFSKPKDFNIVLQEDRKYLNFTFDPAHAYLSKQYDEDWLDIFKKKLDHVHAVDTNGKVDGHPALGEPGGKVDWIRNIRKLDEIGYAGNLVLENWTMENAVKSKKYLESIMN